MGNEKKEIKNLSAKNVYRDKGTIDRAIVLEIERQYQIKFPDRYYKFRVLTSIFLGDTVNDYEVQ